MISPSQIRAARALLNWDAAELSRRSGIARATIFNIENGVTHGRDESLSKIRTAFDAVGIEFIENDGIRRKLQNVEIFEGTKRFDEFYDFIYEHLKHHGGNVCVAGSSGKRFSQFRRDPDEHRRRMMELKQEREDFSVRILIEEGDDFTPNKAFAIYKRQKKELFPPTAFYVFGSCVALITFEGSNPPLVVLLKSELFAEAYLRFFDLAWEYAESINLQE